MDFYAAVLASPDPSNTDLSAVAVPAAGSLFKDMRLWGAASMGTLSADGRLDSPNEHAVATFHEKLAAEPLPADEDFEAHLVATAKEYLNANGVRLRELWFMTSDGPGWAATMTLLRRQPTSMGNVVEPSPSALCEDARLTRKSEVSPSCLLTEVLD